MSIMSQDMYASIGLTTDYRREDSSSMSAELHSSTIWYAGCFVVRD